MQLHSYIYCLPYIGIAFLCLFCYRYELQASTRKITAQFLFLFLLFFIGLRGHLYTDFISYYAFFQEIPTLCNIEKILNYSEYEFGFTIYTSIFKTFIPNYYAWVFFNAIWDLIILTWFFTKYSKSVVFSFIFFIAFSGIVLETNLYRNVKAISLFLLSIPYLQQKRFIPYLLLNIIGVTFHSSSIIYIPLYFILNKTFPIKLLLILFVFVNILFFCNIDITGNIIEFLFLQLKGAGKLSKLYAYQANSTEAYGLSMGYLERTMGFIIVLINYKRMIADSSINKILCNSFFLYYLLFYFFFNVAVLTQRIPLLFIYSYWIVYPNLLSLVKRYRSNIYAFAFCFCILKITMSYSSIICRYDNLLLGGIMPYEDRKNIYLNNPELW